LDSFNYIEHVINRVQHIIISITNFFYLADYLLILLEIIVSKVENKLLERQGENQKKVMNLIW